MLKCEKRKELLAIKIVLSWLLFSDSLFVHSRGLLYCRCSSKSISLVTQLGRLGK